MIQTHSLKLKHTQRTVLASEYKYGNEHKQIFKQTFKLFIDRVVFRCFFFSSFRFMSSSWFSSSEKRNSQAIFEQVKCHSAMNKSEFLLFFNRFFWNFPIASLFCLSFFPFRIALLSDQQWHLATERLKTSERYDFSLLLEMFMACLHIRESYASYLLFCTNYTESVCSSSSDFYWNCQYNQKLWTKASDECKVFFSQAEKQWQKIWIYMKRSR